MVTEFPHELCFGKDKKPDAKLSYKISISCSKGIHIHDVAKKCGKLSLIPSDVTDASSIICNCPSVEICVPPCITSMTKELSVNVENTCQSLCKDGFIWTSTNKHASVSEAYEGDTIQYTVTFTNYSSHKLDRVRIFDTISAKVKVIPDSIQPSPGPGETLKTGISMGSVEAGKTVALTYKAVVRSGVSGCIANTAYAKYCYIDCRGCCLHGVGSRKCNKVKILEMDYCRCKHAQRCFHLHDFESFRHYYIELKDATYHKNGYGGVVKARFDIVVEYIDSTGERKNQSYESDIVFSKLPVRFDSERFRVRFKNLICRVNSHGQITAKFEAKLYYCKKK